MIAPFRTMACLLVAVLPSFIDWSANAQDVSRQDQVRAAMVVNFGRYAEWSNQEPQNAMTVCVAQEATIRDAITALQGSSFDGITVSVTLLEQTSPSSCHIAYVGEALANPADTRVLNDAGVLTVSDAAGFSEYGVIELVSIGRQTRFKVNNQVAQQSNIQLSSRLLRLAVEVR